MGVNPLIRHLVNRVDEIVGGHFLGQLLVGLLIGQRGLLLLPLCSHKVGIDAVGDVFNPFVRD